MIYFVYGDEMRVTVDVAHFQQAQHTHATSLHLQTISSKYQAGFQSHSFTLLSFIMFDVRAEQQNGKRHSSFWLSLDIPYSNQYMCIILITLQVMPNKSLVKSQAIKIKEDTHSHPHTLLIHTVHKLTSQPCPCVLFM